MTHKDDGGCAFPIVEQGGHGMLVASSYGISVRDYFAAASMQGLLASGIAADGNYQPEIVADLSYKHADAMLQARKS